MSVSPDFGLTPELIAFVKQQEGLVLHPYTCPAGAPTIGYGHVIPSLDHPPITEGKATELLMADLRLARDGVLRYSPSMEHESPRRLAALIDFAFNCGVGAYCHSTLRKAVDEHDWPEAAKQMKRWVYAAGKVFQPLVHRREVAARWLVEG